MPQVFAYIEHRNGLPDDSGFELAAAAMRIHPSASRVALVCGWGAEFERVCESIQAWYDEVWKIGNEALVYPNAELVRAALVKVLPQGRFVLIPHDHFGIDLGPGLSIKLNAAFVSDIVGSESVEKASLKVVRQEFGGQVSTHVVCDVSAGAVLTVRPGAFKPLEQRSGTGTIVDKSSELGLLVAKRRYMQTIAAEAGEVDITKHAVLVSVGRGIQDKDNIAIAQELANEMGAAVSCSRPVVDAKWLEKSRQVGSSGKTVKPKVYLACGISGAFQHLAGIKGSPFIIAINKNPKAPIFQVADIGIVDDVLEFLPELTAKIRAMHSISAK
jgi:electron transfer flavoprotein alpha subunit